MFILMELSSASKAPFLFILLMVQAASAYPLVPQGLVFQSGAGNYAQIFNSGECPSCLSIASYQDTGMTAFVDSQHHVVQVALYYTNSSANPTRQMVENTTILAYVPYNKELWLLYTDENGIATFNLSPYDNAQNAICQRFIFFYCPFSNGCGFQECLDMLNITSKNAAIPTSLSAAPQPPGNFVPGQILMPETYSLLPAVATVPYCPQPPQAKDKGSVEFCLPFLIILALLVGALQVSGRNPFGAFDLSTPRIGQHVRYEARMRGKSINWGSIIMAYARTSLEFAGGGEGEAKEGEAKAEGGGAPAGPAKGGAPPAGAKGGKIGQVQRSTTGVTPAAKSKVAWYDKPFAGEGGPKGLSQWSVSGIVGGVVPFVGLGRNMVLTASAPPQKAQPGADAWSALGNMLVLALRTSNLYQFLLPAFVPFGAGSGKETRDAKGGVVSTGDRSDHEAIKKFLHYVPILGLLFDNMFKGSVANANEMRKAEERKAAALDSALNVRALSPKTNVDLSNAQKMSLNMEGKQVQGLFLEGGDAKAKTGFAFINGQIVQVKNGAIVTEPGPPGAKGNVPNYVQLNVGGTIVYLDSRSLPKDGAPISITGIAMSSSGARAELKDNKIVAMEVNGQMKDVITDPFGNQRLVPRPIMAGTDEFKKLGNQIPESALSADAVGPALREGKQILMPTLDGRTVEAIPLVENGKVKFDDKGNMMVHGYVETNAKLIEGGSPQYGRLPAGVREAMESQPPQGGPFPSTYTSSDGKTYGVIRDSSGNAVMVGMPDGKLMTLGRDESGNISKVLVTEQQRSAVGSKEFAQIMGVIDPHQKVDMVSDPNMNRVTTSGGMSYSVERDSAGRVTALNSLQIDVKRDIVGTESNPLTLSAALHAEAAGPAGVARKEITVGDLVGAYAAHTGISMDLADKEHLGLGVAFTRDGRLGVRSDALTAQGIEVSLGRTDPFDKTGLLVISDDRLIARMETPGTAEEKILANTFRREADGSISNAHTGERLSDAQAAILLANVPNQGVNDIGIDIAKDPDRIKRLGTDQLRFEQSEGGPIVRDGRTGKELTGAKENEAMAFAREILPKDCWLGQGGFFESANKQRDQVIEAHQNANYANAEFRGMFMENVMDDYYKAHPALANFQKDLAGIAEDRGTSGRAEEERKIHEAVEKAGAKDPEINQAVLEQSARRLLADPGDPARGMSSGYELAQRTDTDSKNWVGEHFIRGEPEMGPGVAGGSFVTNLGDLFIAAGDHHGATERALETPTLYSAPPDLDVGKIVSGAANDAVAVLGYVNHHEPANIGLLDMHESANAELAHATAELRASDQRQAEEEGMYRRINSFDLAIGFTNFVMTTGKPLEPEIHAPAGAPAGGAPGEPPEWEKHFMEMRKRPEAEMAGFESMKQEYIRTPDAPSHAPGTNLRLEMPGFETYKAPSLPSQELRPPSPIRPPESEKE